MNPNQATIMAIYEAFGTGNIPVILEKLDDKVEWESWQNNSAQEAGVPWLIHRKGKEGAVEFFKIVGSMQITDFQVLSIMANENQVVAEILIEATIPETGKTVKDEELHLWKFNSEGKVISMRHYLDTHKHMQAATVNVFK